MGVKLDSTLGNGLEQAKSRDEAVEPTLDTARAVVATGVESIARET
jgi:hypothetical protein